MRIKTEETFGSVTEREMDPAKAVLEEFQTYLASQQRPGETLGEFYARLQKAEQELVSRKELFTAILLNGALKKSVKERIAELGPIPDDDTLKELIAQEDALHDRDQSAAISSPSTNGEEIHFPTSSINEDIYSIAEDIENLLEMDAETLNLLQEIEELQLGPRPLFLVECKTPRVVFDTHFPAASIFVVKKNDNNEIEIDSNVQGKIRQLK